ncbi:MAG: T9SS type A sorting domain-containing protein [Bacteroidota bacterium]|nr:T9SS type A sorting domain-containing protein [Bacteroidota bacterium]
MKKTLSFICLALIFNSALFTQIIYTDPNPDITVLNNSIYLLDVNNDGIEDFKFLHEDAASGLNGNGLGVAILHLDAEFLGGMPAQDPTHYYPYKLEYNTFIDINANGNEWVVKHPDPDFVRVLNLQFNNGSYAGLWVFGVTNRYLGIRIRLNNLWHYGWIRLDVSANALTMQIKDWAYESSAGVGIFTGDSTSNILAGAALNVSMQDVDNTNSSADAQVDFTKAPDESGVSEYRVIIVKEAGAASFDITTAGFITANQYQSISPNGLNQSVVLHAGLLDADGDIIQENIAYQAFVLSIADGIVATSNNLSLPSTTTTLLNTISIASYHNNEIMISLQDKKLKVSTENQQKYFMSIYTITGDLVFKTIAYSDFAYDTRNLSGSVYIVRVYNNNLFCTKKFFIP